MPLYYEPDGSGPFYTDEGGVIPGGVLVLQTGSEGATSVSVITDVRIDGGNLEVKRTTLYVSDSGTESGWEVIGAV